jgi:hypothetical protein
MSAATEDVAFRVTLQGEQAKRELDAIRGRAATLGGGLEQLQDGLKRVNETAGRTVQKGLVSMQFALGSSAGAAREVVGSLGDMAAILGTGGVAGIALAAGTLAAVKIAEAYKLASENSRVFADATKALGDNIERTSNEKLAGFMRRIDDLRTQAQNFGLTGGEVTARDVNSQLEADRRALEGTERLLADAKEKAQIAAERATGLRSESVKEEAESTAALVTGLERRAEALRDRVAKLGARAEEAGLLAWGLSVAGQTPAAADFGALPDQFGSPGAPFSAGSMGEDPVEIARFRAEDARARAGQVDDDKRRDAEIAAEEEKQKELLAIQKMAYEKMGQAFDEQAEKHQRAVEQWTEAELNTRKAAAAEVIGIGVSATQSLIDGFITGQENALEHFAANVMKQAGTAMIGHGINAAAGGIARLALGDPTGAVPLGVGSALIVGGVGLGGAATGIEHVLAGGQIGKALPEAKADLGGGSFDRGVNSGRGSLPSRGERGAGTVHVHINYAVGGPPAEDTAREMERVLRTGRRRGILQ